MTASPYRWVMLGLVWLAYASFGLVSASVAPLVTPITADLGLSYGQMGTILGAWQLTYIGVAYAAGTIIDRFGLRRALGVGVLVIAASALLRSAATGYWTMFLFVAIFGLGGPMISIGAPKLIATWFAGRERATAAGIYTTGPAIGSILVLSTANALLLPATGGWRPTIAAYGVIVLLVAAVWWSLARDHGERGSGPGGAAGAAARLLRIRNVRLVLLIGFASFLANHSLGSWLPRILEARGFDRVDAGVWASIPQAVGIVGALTLPRLVRPERRAAAIGLGFAVFGASLAMIALAEGPVLLGALVLNGLVRSTMVPLLMLVMMETPEVGAAAMGAAGGLFFTVGEVGGFSGPSVMGLLFDLTGGFALGLMLLAGVMLVMASLSTLIERPDDLNARPMR